MGNFKEIAKVHYERMVSTYSLETQMSFKASKVYDNTKFCEYTLANGNTPQILVKDSNVSNEIVKLSKQYDKICVLNFASFTSPGGGFMNGAMAQEEALCHVTNLFNVLNEFRPLYEKNKLRLHNGLYEDWAIYSPNVIFDNYQHTAKVDVITCAAPNANSFFSKTQSENAVNKYSDIIYNRCKYILNIAEQNNVKILVLGAFGCGVFGNNPYCIAECFQTLLETKKYNFDVVSFPIPGGQNLEAFKEVFKEYI